MVTPSREAAQMPTSATSKWGLDSVLDELLEK